VDSAFGRARDEEQATVRCLTRIRALVADDFPDFRTVIVALFTMEDRIEVIARVSDGREAIEAVALFPA
jgi:CheY-like chemotaxis protein